MNVITKSAALAVAAAALVAPVLLATAGPAQAAPSPDYHGGPVTVRYQEGPAGLGVNASIWDNANPAGVVEVCQYSSIGTNGMLPFSGSAVLNGPGPGTVHIPGGPLGGQWNVNVHCDGTGQSANFPVYY